MSKMLEWTTKRITVGRGHRTVLRTTHPEPHQIIAETWAYSTGTTVLEIEFPQGSRGVTTTRATEIAQIVQDVLDGQPSVSEVLEQVVGKLNEARKAPELTSAPEDPDDVEYLYGLAEGLDSALAVVRSFMPPASEGEG